MATQFNYIRNIPFSTNNPAADQPNMLTNTNSISSIIAVDHLGFNTAQGSESDGYHTVIHFSTQGGDPAAIGTIGQLYTKTLTIGNQDQCLFFESGGGRITQLTGILGGAGSQTSTVNAPNGYTPLTGGIILQWGQFATTAASTPVLFTTLNIDFPTNCFNIQITPTAPSTSTSGARFATNTISNTGFTLNTTGYTVGSTFDWLAIGN
jgi:hypothetical protein